MDRDYSLLYDGDAEQYDYYEGTPPLYDPAEDRLDETHLERVCAEFSELIADYGTTEVFKELPDDVVFDIISYIEDFHR